MGRKKEIKIRLSATEHAALVQKRGRMRLASWMRTTCLDGMPAAIPKINVQALAELHRIGSNLNQIARSVNSGSDATNLHELRAQVSDLRATLAGAAK